jgi:hypothetical protein
MVHKFLCSFANFLIRLRVSEEGGLLPAIGAPHLKIDYLKSFFGPSLYQISSGKIVRLLDIRWRGMARVGRLRHEPVSRWRIADNAQINKPTGGSARAMHLIWFTLT